MGRITGYSHVNNGSAQSQPGPGLWLRQLESLDQPDGQRRSTSYTYDATGNRTSKIVGGDHLQQHGGQHEQSADADAGRGRHQHDQYDAAGHITSDGANSYTYNDRGRMSSATTAGGTVNYLYNGLEQRVQKSGPTSLVPTGASYFLYDDAGQLLGEYDAAAPRSTKRSIWEARRSA